jgi:predicted outer membrane repeat protein
MCGASAAAPRNITHTNLNQTSMNQNTTQLTKTTTIITSKIPKSTVKLPDPQIYNNGQPVARGVYPAGYVFGTLIGAIIVADPGDTIMLESNATFNQIGTGLIISKNLNFDVFNNGTAYINGNGISSTGHIFTINPGVTVNINNIVFENALNTAIENSGDLTVNNCTFLNNTVDGAIYSNGTYCTINDTIFENNSASFGGAIYNDVGSSLTVNNSAFTNNKANADGGAIWNEGLLTLTSNNLINNSAYNDDGAIFNNPGGLLMQFSTDLLETPQ